MGEKNFEQLLGFHAAPMLAGLKPSSLLSFQKSKYQDFNALLASYEACFRCNGISVCRLAEGEEYILVLFYRAKALEASVSSSGAREILQRCSYPENASLSELLAELQLRMHLKKTFPHEVGLFLGYPPEDVRGFMEHKGQDFAYSGYWKVYANEQETRKLFAKYSSCTHEFCTKLEAGATLPELLQAAS